MTEVNRKASVKEEWLVEQGRGSSLRASQADSASIDFLTDEKKKSKFLTAISGRSDYKEKCKMLSRSAPKLILTVRISADCRF